MSECSKFEWVIWLKLHPHECQDPDFPLKHCTAAMISVVHCQFNVIIDRLQFDNNS